MEKPSKWAARVGVSPNVVSNIHGKTKQNPSLEYIIAVSKATSTSMEFLLWGGKEDAPILDEDPEIAELLDGARKVLTSGNPIAFDALERNIRYFAHAVATEKRMEILEAEMDEMKHMVMDLKSTTKCGTAIEEEEPTKKKAM